jgi:mannose-6-phosphate isomerase-like protein (cupin superfamily)
MINQIETGRTSPSVVSLRRIAHALGVPLAEFFADGPDASSPPAALEPLPEIPPALSADPFTPLKRGMAVVVRRNRRKRLQLPESHVIYELLTPDLKWAVEALWVELEPNHPPIESMAHPGHECAVVVTGTMHVIVGNDEYVLEPGDSITLDSSVPHRIENRGTEKVIQISAITPPSF